VEEIKEKDGEGEFNYNTFGIKKFCKCHNKNKYINIQTKNKKSSKD
jgi:hypothetical protein